MKTAERVRQSPPRLCPTCGNDGVYSPAAFRAVIDRERCRSDRNSHGFSLVVFGLEKGNRREAQSRRLIGALLDQARCTDEAGWMSGSEIGVLLPETYASGANRFAEKVRGAMSKRGFGALSCHVYTYPSTWLLPDDGDSRQLWFEDIIRVTDRDSRPVAFSSFDARSLGGDDGTQRVFSAMSGDALDRFLASPPPRWKRFADIAGALIGLVLLSPVMLLIALLIKIFSPGPVFFRQERVGYLGKPFVCWKFRTMHDGADPSVHRDHLNKLIQSDIPLTKLDADSDPRLIPMGRLLRKCGLDELPQLVNVLRGDMSLIGPRPCIPYEYHEYSRWQRRRVEAPPGLTGLWQVSGKNRTTFCQMMRLDIAYAQKRTLWLDLRILWRTFPAIVGQMREDGDGRGLRVRFRQALAKVREQVRQEAAQRQSRACRTGA